MLLLNTQIHFDATDKLIASGYSANQQADASMYCQLAELSRQKQWILFTSQCPRPVQAELSQYEINCSAIIHMKPSLVSTEEEIVIKAIKARTASAIVASNELSAYAKANILNCAAQYHCRVFFLNDKTGKLADIRH